MASRECEIADLIVEDLNSQTWSMDFEAIRRLNPEPQQADIDEVRVIVVPRASTLEAETRKTNANVIRVDVGIIKRIPHQSDLEQHGDALLSLRNEIEDRIIGRRYENDDGTRRFITTQGESDPLYFEESLKESNTFCSVISVTCSMRNDRA